MGSAQSSPESVQQMQSYVQELVNHPHFECPKVQGGAGHKEGSTIGDIATATSAVISDSKKQIIRSMAKIAKETLGLNINPDSDNVHTLVDKLREQLPDPRKGKTITNLTDKQEKLCKKLAEKINELSGKQIITADDPKEVCTDVSDILNSLARGFQTEFLGVMSNLERALQNLQELSKYVDGLYKDLYASLKSCEQQGVNTVLSMKFGDIDKIHALVHGEIQKQIEVINNLLETQLKPANENLLDYLKENDELEGLISKLKDAGLGTEEFADRIAYGFRKTSQVAGIASKAEKALQKLGLSISELQGSDTVVDEKLRQSLIDAVEKLDKKDAEKLSNLTTSFQFLKQILSKPDLSGDVVAELKKKSKSVSGSAERKQGGLSLGKKQSKARKAKSILADAFASSIVQTMQDIPGVIEEISNKFRSPDSDLERSAKLDRFYKSLTDREEIANADVFYALFGLDRSGEGQQRKEDFVEWLKSVRSAAQDVKKTTDSADKEFETLVKYVDSLLEQIEKATRSISGSGEHGDEQAVTGGYQLNIDMSKFRKKAMDFSKAINRFSTSYRVSQFRFNLARASREMKDFVSGKGNEDGVEYAKILGKAVHDSYKAQTSRLAQQIKDYDASASQIPQIPEEQKKAYETDKYQTIKTAQCDTVKKFYQALEALDLYLAKFTDVLVNNPKDVENLEDLVENMKVIVRYYNENSGNSLVKAFEEFPFDINNGLIDSVDVSQISPSPDNHYYSILAQAARTVRVGDVLKIANPYLAVDPQRAQKAIDHVKEGLDALSVIKNLVSLFIYVGEKIGGERLKFTGFTSNQIVDAIKNFLIHCSFVDGWNIDGEDKQTVKTKGNVTTSKLSIPVRYRASIKIKSSDWVIPSIDSRISSGVGDIGEARVNEARKKGGIVFSSVNNIGFKDLFKDEQKLFVLAMKAMMTKVFTVLGTHSMLTVPTIFRNSAVRPTRVILGAAEGDSDVEIKEEALELYIRLPLLAEFYRELIGYRRDPTDLPNTGPPNDPTRVLTFTPEIEGRFGDLLDIVFEQTNHVNFGSYSDAQSKKLIKAINSIYDQIASGSSQKDVSARIVDEFISEMNRRIGLFKKEEILQELEDRKRYGVQGVQYGRASADRVDYDILPEDDKEGSAPSSKYFTAVVSSENDLSEVNKYKFHMEYIDMIKQFRDKIDETLSNMGEDQYKHASFEETIRQCKEELKSSLSQSDKVSVVVRAIQGTNKISTIGIDKVLMFHETVVAPLNMLNDLYRKISSFSDLIYGMSVDQYDAGSLSSLKLANLLNSLYGIGSDLNDLLSVRVSGSSVSIEYSPLIDMVNNVLDFVKYSFNKFRPILAKTKLQRFENPTTPGSIYYLEEHFRNGLLYDKNPNVFGLNKINDKLAQIMDKLISRNSDPDPTNNNRAELGETLARLLVYEGPVGITPFIMAAGIANTPPSFYSALKERDPNNNNLQNIDIGDRFDFYSGNREFSNYTGKALLLAFNNIVAQYLNVFFDRGNKKIYGGLIEDMVNGVLNRAIMDGYAFPDVRGGANFDWNDKKTLPKPDVVLFASIARSLRQIYTVQNKQATGKQFVIDNLADVPAHIKSAMKANLPIFLKMLDLLIKKVTVLKILTDGDMEATFNDNGHNPIDRQEGLHTGTRSQAEAGQVGNQYFRQLMDNIVQAANSVKRNIMNVMSELSDEDPKYFEIYDNFISSYKDLYGHEPFMPASLLNATINSDSEEQLLPLKLAGEPGFKFNMGTRLTLHMYGKEPTIDHMPYVQHMIKAYNSTAEESYQLDEKRFSKFILSQNKLYRYSLDCTLYRKILGGKIDRIGPVPPQNVASYEVQSSLQDVVGLVENSNVESSKKKLTENISTSHHSVSSTSRVIARTVNLIDLNVIPINVNALMSHIAFANIINYGLTFDRVVQELLIGEFKSDFTDDVMNNNVVSGNKMLTYLLLNPHGPVTTEQYVESVGRIARGAVGNDLGRPRYIDEELWNKSLLNEAYLADGNVAKETGPAGMHDKAVGPAPPNSLILATQTGNSQLNTMVKDNNNQVKSFDLSNTAFKEYAMKMGKLRFDTHLVRNLFFLTNLQRVTILKIREELTAIRDAVAEGKASANRKVTEYRGKEVLGDVNKLVNQ